MNVSRAHTAIEKILVDERERTSEFECVSATIRDLDLKLTILLQNVGHIPEAPTAAAESELEAECMRLEDDILEQDLQIAEFEANLCSQQKGAAVIDSFTPELEAVRQQCATLSLRIDAFQRELKIDEVAKGNDGEQFIHPADDTTEQELFTEKERTNQLRELVANEEKMTMEAQFTKEKSAVERGELEALEVEHRDLLLELFSCPGALGSLSSLLSATMISKVSRMTPGPERTLTALAFLKAIVINLDDDLRRLTAVSQQNAAGLEQSLKAAHNEVKVGISPCIPREYLQRFNQTAHKQEEWPLTLELLEDNFPHHKLDVVYAALQQMVLCCDGLAMEMQAESTTLQDLSSNAHTLLMIAYYVVRKRREKWAEKLLRPK